MIEFMLLAAPRCATTWASNWLTTDETLCLHDPLWQRHYSELDNIESSKTLGVACTGLFMFPEFVNNHPARKIILHRPLNEINESLAGIGIPPMTEKTWRKTYDIGGIHVDWDVMFNEPKPFYEYLTERPFDAERFELLREIEMQPKFAELKPNGTATTRLVEELRRMGAI